MVTSTDNVNCSKFVVLAGIGFWIIDYVTDIGTLLSYWKNQSQAIAILSTLSIIIATIGGIGMVCVVGWSAKSGRYYTQKWMIFPQWFEAMFESIPQLMINLYVLSISCYTNAIPNKKIWSDNLNTTFPNGSNSFQETNFTEVSTTADLFIKEHGSSTSVPAIQYISAISSFIGVCIGILQMDKLFSISYKFVLAKFDWLEILFLFISKGSGLVGRILILVYSAFVLNWSTFIFFGLHGLGSAFGLAISLWNEIKCSLPFVFSAIAVASFLQFTWYLDSDYIHTTVIGCLVYSAENLILLAIATNPKTNHEKYCFYSHAIELNIGLNVACMFFGILFTLKRRRTLDNEDKNFDESIKRIGKWTKRRKTRVMNVINNFICCGKESDQTADAGSGISGKTNRPEHEQGSFPTRRGNTSLSCEMIEMEPINSGQCSKLTETDELLSIESIDISQQHGKHVTSDLTCSCSIMVELNVDEIIPIPLITEENKSNLSNKVTKGAYLETVGVKTTTTNTLEKGSNLSHDDASPDLKQMPSSISRDATNVIVYEADTVLVSVHATATPRQMHENLPGLTTPDSSSEQPESWNAITQMIDDSESYQDRWGAKGLVKEVTPKTVDDPRKNKMIGT